MLGAWRLSLSKRRKGFRCDDPAGDSRVKTLGQEGTEGLVLPGLNISRGPVVEQAVPGDGVLGLFDRNRTPKLVAGADPDAQLQFEIESLRWPEGWRSFVGKFALPAGTTYRLARDTDGRASPVVANRNPFVVGQQGIVWTEQLAHVFCVHDSRIKVGVVADAGGQQEIARRGGMQKLWTLCSSLCE